MKKFNQYLIETSKSEIEKYLENVVYLNLLLGAKYQKKCPEEKTDIKYMENIFFKSKCEWFGFIYNALKKGNFIENSFIKTNKNASKYRSGCYYNALDYILRFEKDYSKIELAFGIVFEQKEIKDVENYLKNRPGIHYTPIGLTLHAFLVVNKNKIIDPTLGKNKDLYIYQSIPKSIWSRFSHKFNDSNYNAKPFVDYIDKEINKKIKKFPYIKIANNIKNKVPDFKFKL